MMKKEQKYASIRPTTDSKTSLVHRTDRLLADKTSVAIYAIAGMANATRDRTSTCFQSAIYTPILHRATASIAPPLAVEVSHTCTLCCALRRPQRPNPNSARPGRIASKTKIGRLGMVKTHCLRLICTAILAE